MIMLFDYVHDTLQRVEKDHRFSQFLLFLILFLVGSPVVLWSIDMFTLRTYLVFVFVWFLILCEVFVPSSPKANWWRRLQWARIVSWVAVAYIVVEKVLAVLQ